MCIEDRVQRGIDLLNRHGPDEWQSRIDLLTLNLATGDTCVLGQLYGTYGNGIYSLTQSNGLADEPDAYGFLSSEKMGTAVGEEYEALRQAWINQLCQRLAETTRAPEELADIEVL